VDGLSKGNRTLPPSKEEPCTPKNSKLVRAPPQAASAHDAVCLPSLTYMYSKLQGQYREKGSQSTLHSTIYPGIIPYQKHFFLPKGESKCCWQQVGRASLR